MKHKQPALNRRQGEAYHPELSRILDSGHRLVKLAQTVDWDRMDEIFGEIFYLDNVLPCAGNRLMLSMNYLGFLYNLSDDDIVSIWAENPYWQYLCGMQIFEHNPPVGPSDLANWRKRIREAGKEEVLEKTTIAGLNLEAVDPYLLNPKVIKIEENEIKNTDLLSKIQKTWFHRFYSIHLKQYAFVRWIFLWLWRTGQPLYVNIFLALQSTISRRNERRWRSLIKLSEFAEKRGSRIYKLADEGVVNTPEPQIFPSCDQGYLVSPHDHYKFPDIWVTTIRKGMIYGGSNFTLIDEEVVCHDFYDFKSDYTSEELHGRTLINPKASRIRMLLNDEKPKHIAAAATFVDACAPNYAHWMTEVLPSVAAFCTDQRFKNIPIVINDGLHKNIMEALLLITGEEREIYLLPIGRGLSCEMVYITSTTGYVPFEWRAKKPLRCGHGLFSPVALGSLRKHFIGMIENKDAQILPEKIFIKRNSNYRVLVNSNAVEKLFILNGFVVVEPEKLTFLQQVALFKYAKVIVSPSGAALANLIFAPTDAKIFILISKHPDTIYWYWQNIACATGKKINYIFGEINDKKLRGIHSSFTIDLGLIASLLSETEKPYTESDGKNETI